MKIYEVGGAVRDELLGLPVKDRDYVVVGATPEEMIDQGFRPVGRDFPVFLHPDTHEEHALARTERKTARGYHGFEFHAATDVTLEQDLARRDLTINAIARDEDGTLIDPFNGAEDLSAGMLRHVSPAFAEDPVRILRVARFAARFGFDIAPETYELMREMVRSGEADALVAERVWQEFAKGLSEGEPSQMLEVLHECGAIGKVAPEIAALFLDGTAAQAMTALDAAARADAPLDVRVATLSRFLDPYAVNALAERMRWPAAVRELALLASRHGNAVLDAEGLDAEGLLEVLNAADVWRRPERFNGLIQAVGAGESGVHAAFERLRHARDAALAVDAGSIAAAAQASGAGGDIKSRVAQARLDAVQAQLSNPQVN